MNAEQQQLLLEPQSATTSLTNSIQKLFPEQTYEEKALQKARQILGNKAQELSPEELQVQLSMIQFLVTAWVDEFEQNIFDGKTLRELLHEKGKI